MELGKHLYYVFSQKQQWLNVFKFSLYNIHLTDTKHAF